MILAIHFSDTCSIFLQYITQNSVWFSLKFQHFSPEKIPRTSWMKTTSTTGSATTRLWRGCRCSSAASWRGSAPTCATRWWRRSWRASVAPGARVVVQKPMILLISHEFGHEGTISGAVWLRRLYEIEGLYASHQPLLGVLLSHWSHYC